MNPLNQMVQGMFSDNSNVLLAAIISLLLVILFVLLLHVYAKWFLAQAQAQAQARRRRGRRRTVTVSDVLGPARFHHFHNLTIEDSPFSISPTKGLDSSIIAAIPLFVFEETEEGEKQIRDEQELLECVICLSCFEDGEIGRSLPKCGHCFHVECIDMWLGSHCNCPTCRAPINGGIVENDSQLGSVNGDSSSSSSSSVLEIVIDSPSSEVSENENGNESNGSVNVSAASVSVSEISSSLLGVGCTLKRVLSKVFPSSNANVLDS